MGRCPILNRKTRTVDKDLWGQQTFHPCQRYSDDGGAACSAPKKIRSDKAIRVTKSFRQNRRHRFRRRRRPPDGGCVAVVGPRRGVSLRVYRKEQMDSIYHAEAFKKEDRGSVSLAARWPQTSDLQRRWPTVTPLRINTAITD